MENNYSDSFKEFLIQNSIPVLKCIDYSNYNVVLGSGFCGNIKRISYEDAIKEVYCMNKNAK